MYFVVIIVSLMLYSNGVSGDTCEAMDCLTDEEFPIIQRLLSYQPSSGDTSIPFIESFSLQSGQSLCVRLPTLEACIKEELVNCERQKQSLLRGTLKTLVKLCSIQPKQYEEMTKCVDTGPEPFKNCSDSYQTSTHRAVKQYSKAGQLQEAFCRLTEGYLDCLYYEVRDKCGHHVAITFRSLMVQLFRPTFSPYGCAIRESIIELTTTVQTPITFGAVVAGVQEEGQIGSKRLQKVIFVTVGILGFLGAITAAVFIVWHVTSRKRKRYAKVIQKDQNISYETNNSYYQTKITTI